MGGVIETFVEEKVSLNDVLTSLVQKNLDERVVLTDNISKKISTILSDKIVLTDKVLKSLGNEKNADINLLDSLSLVVAKNIVDSLGLDDVVVKNTKKVLIDNISLIPGSEEHFEINSYCTGKQNNAGIVLEMLKDKINSIDGVFKLHYIDVITSFGAQVTGVLIYGE